MINLKSSFQDKNSENDALKDPMELLGPRFTAHVPIPTQQDIESALLRKKKQELLDKYTNWRTKKCIFIDLINQKRIELAVQQYNMVSLYMPRRNQ